MKYNLQASNLMDGIDKLQVKVIGKITVRDEFALI
jgi:hypothetical protein